MNGDFLIRMDALQRRQFIKNSAIALAAAVAGGTDFALPILADGPATGVSWNKAPCRFCGTGCHVQVGVQNGKVVAVQGDQRAEVNKGLLCVKGYHVPLALY